MDVAYGDIVYLNAQSLLANIDEIGELIDRRKPLILILSETCVTKEIEDSELIYNGYKCYRCDSHTRYTGGVVAYVKNSVKIESLKEYKTNYIWWLTLKIKLKQSIYVTILYRSPSGKKQEFLNFFEEWCDEEFEDNNKHLICGDFNID